MQTLVSISWLIPLLPLLGAAVAGFAGARYLRGNSHWPIWITVGGSAVLSVAILLSLIVSRPNAQVTYYDPVLAAAAGQGERGGQGEAAAGEGYDFDTSKVSAEVKAYSHRFFTWIEAGNPAEAGVLPGTLDDPQATRAGGFFDVAAGVFIDPLTGVMLAVVCGIGFFITVFAAGYMKGEEGYWRFFAYLGLFLFAMTVLVMGDNLVLLYLGWEGVGLCSYLLIGYYYQKPAAREAAKKAFLVNRVGDFGFALGILSVFYCFGTVSYYGDGVGTNSGFLEMAVAAYADPTSYFAGDPLRQWLAWLTPFFLMIGAFGKSAQFPLYVWLPDAMEGPTPVSALIHAATMVTAGIYMIARTAPIFFSVNAALVTVAVVGAFTAAFAGTIALRQFDLKKVFAYSTVSQLGFMFVGVAVLAPVAAVFHLMTHAFFKALLFLSSGVVMHAMMGHLDMRKMSGLKTHLPKTRILCGIGCLALAGFPLTAGYFSKDEIIHFAQINAGPGAWVLMLVLLGTAFMTAYYTFRLYFRVFEGPELVPDGPAPDHHVGHDDAHGAAVHGHDAHARASGLSPELDAEAKAHGRASASAVQEGDVASSGVDEAATQGPHPHDVASPHAHDAHHGHEAHDHEPPVMMIPLIVLAAGALLAGFTNFPVHFLGAFLGTSPSFALGMDAAITQYAGQSLPSPAGFGQGTDPLSSLLPGLLLGAIISVAGIGLAWFLHLKDRGRAVSLAHVMRPAAKLLEGKYFVDEIYNALVVAPLRATGKVLFAVDRYVVDGAVWTASFVPQAAGLSLKMFTQRGALQGYALSMLLGVAVILLFLLL